MLLTLAVTTYERPEALSAVLRTVGLQTHPPDELIVADDGSGEATGALIARFAAGAPYPVHHVRQEHEGFRLARLRNLAIARARGEYLVFIDGDMLLHRQFLADHARQARRGSFVQGVRIRLDPAATARQLAPDALPPTPFAPGLGILRRLYALRHPALGALGSRPGNAVVALKGCNQAFWRADLLAVNGYNEDIVGWGPEDKELCVRLARHGVRRRTLLFGGIAWHLHHAAAARDRRACNEGVLAATLASATVRCARGLDAHLARGDGAPP